MNDHSELLRLAMAATTNPQDAAYIAAASPDRIIDLVKEVDDNWEQGRKAGINSALQACIEYAKGYHDQSSSTPQMVACRGCIDAIRALIEKGEQE